MNKYLVLFLLLSMAFMVFGCGTTAPVKLMDTPQATGLSKKHERPLRYNVAFAPVAIKPMPKPKGMYAFSVKPDATAMREELAKTLKDFKVFDNLLTINVKDETEALQIAREQGADLLLTADVTKYSISYDQGTRGTGAVIAWLFSPWISWLVADEIYSADIAINMKLQRISDGSIIQEIPLSGKATCELDDIQRGLKTHEYIIGSIFTGPGSLDEKNFEKAATVVAPHAMQELQLKMIDEMYNLPQPPPDKKSYALVIGVNASKFSMLPRLKYAEADAVAFEKILKETLPPYDEVKLLLGKEVKLENIRTAIEDFSGREYTEIVNFTVYFAGPGASAEGKHYIALSNSREVSSMLALEDFYSMIEGTEAKNRVLILDTGFAGAESRGLILSGGKLSSFDKSLANSPTVTTISSCGPDQGGHEFDNLGHGVFTSQMLVALKGPADINEDKSITAEELITKLDWDIQRYVRDNTVGQSQKPVVACDKKLIGTVLIKLK